MNAYIQIIVIFEHSLDKFIFNCWYDISFFIFSVSHFILKHPQFSFLWSKVHENVYSISHGKKNQFKYNYNYVIMGAMASQITSLTPVYSTVYSGSD